MRSTAEQWLLATCCLLGLVGCGSRTYPVNGTVVYEDGKPATDLAGGFVSFTSAEEAIGAQGSIQRDATFKLTTDKKDDGAILGRHQVIITPPISYGSESGGGRPPILDPRYSDPKNSGLEAVIEPRTNDVILRLQRPQRHQ